MGATVVKPTHSSRKTFSCQAMENISLNALNIVELLYIGRIYKGEFSMEGKYKGRNERWFQTKKGDTLSGDLGDVTNDNSGDKVNVGRENLVKFLCRSEKLETTEF